jgi:Recombination endonuclease VII
MATKICRGCKIEKSLEDFPLAQSGRYGRGGQCRECRNEKESARQQKPEAKAREKDRYYKSSYGLDIGVLAMMVLARDGKCDIGGEETDLVVDHIHGTQIVRGLISRERNAGVGLLGDNLERVLKAADYLVASEFDVFAGIKQKQLQEGA